LVALYQILMRVLWLVQTSNDPKFCYTHIQSVYRCAQLYKLIRQHVSA